MVAKKGYGISPGWRALLADLGVRHDAVTRHAGLPDDVFNHPEARVSAEQFLAFLRSLYTLVGDPTLAIRLVEAMHAEHFSPTTFAALCSPNLSVAVSRLARFKPLVGPVDLRVFETEQSLRLDYHWELEHQAFPALCGFEILFVVRLARMGTRHFVVPRKVTLTELPESVAAYEEWLGVRVSKGETLSVTFSAEDAQRPFIAANTKMWSIFEPELRRRLAELHGPTTWEARTKAVLLEALPAGHASVGSVARRLAVSSRTLQRRLREEGTHFKQVVRQTRERLAHHYLTQGQLTSTQIAYLLGFEEPTSFFRAFQSWTGTTPESVRRELADPT
jgi:AraC-like DNA-binding protein